MLRLFRERYRLRARLKKRSQDVAKNNPMYQRIINQPKEPRIFFHLSH